MPFSDDDLDAFYRDVEARTAARPAPRRRSMVSAEPTVICPTPDKEAYVAQAVARDAITRIRRRTGPSVHLRCYECACGAWHITSKPPR
ncbi:hypothetical protein AAFP35_15110 [Gordonia sp. CPCC 206044]|uniref:hypothetical protein n=1 Tax=Gordonia sp. CPCC 206044 TaxID=3140793 RepID=UPI003AF360CF